MFLRVGDISAETPRLERSNSIENPKSLEIITSVGTNNSYTLYEDDGQNTTINTEFANKCIDGKYAISLKIIGDKSLYLQERIFVKN